MANHKSSDKRIRQDEAKRLVNKYSARTTRSVLKEVRSSTNKAEAQLLVPKVFSMLDKLAKTKVIHKNKANNLKSSIAAHINTLA